MSDIVFPVSQPKDSGVPWNWNPAATFIAARDNAIKREQDAQKFEMEQKLAEILLPLRQEKAQWEIAKLKATVYRERAHIARAQQVGGQVGGGVIQGIQGQGSGIFTPPPPASSAPVGGGVIQGIQGQGSGIFTPPPPASSAPGIISNDAPVTLDLSSATPSPQEEATQVFASLEGAPTPPAPQDTAMAGNVLSDALLADAGSAVNPNDIIASTNAANAFAPKSNIFADISNVPPRRTEDRPAGRNLMPSSAVAVAENPYGFSNVAVSDNLAAVGADPKKAVRAQELLGALSQNVALIKGMSYGKDRNTVTAEFRNQVFPQYEAEFTELGITPAQAMGAADSIATGGYSIPDALSHFVLGIDPKKKAAEEAAAAKSGGGSSKSEEVDPIIAAGDKIATISKQMKDAQAVGVDQGQFEWALNQANREYAALNKTPTAPVSTAQQDAADLDRLATIKGSGQSTDKILSADGSRFATPEELQAEAVEKQNAMAVRQANYFKMPRDPAAFHAANFLNPDGSVDVPAYNAELTKWKEGNPNAIAYNLKGKPVRVSEIPLGTLETPVAPVEDQRTRLIKDMRARADERDAQNAEKLERRVKGVGGLFLNVLEGLGEGAGAIKG